MTITQAALSTLRRADGSGTFTSSGFSIIAGVNGPIEVQRRDELPDEAAIEVNVRPAVGVGGPRERHIESLIHSTLRHAVLTHLFPRTLVQVTLQILSLPDNESDLRSSMHTHLLPPLLNAATLALLSARIPLLTTPSAVLIAIPPPASATAKTNASAPTAPIANPSPAQIQTAGSIHALCFATSGQVLLCDSSGAFSPDEFDVAVTAGREACLGRTIATSATTPANGHDDEDTMSGDAGDGARSREADADNSSEDDEDDGRGGGVRLNVDMDVDQPVSSSSATALTNAARSSRTGSDDGSVLAAIRTAVETQLAGANRWKSGGAE